MRKTKLRDRKPKMQTALLDRGTAGPRLQGSRLPRLVQPHSTISWPQLHSIEQNNLMHEYLKKKNFCFNKSNSDIKWDYLNLRFWKMF